MFSSSVVSHLKTPLTRADVIRRDLHSLLLWQHAGSAPASTFLSVSRTSCTCHPLPWKAFLLLPAPQASDSSLPRDLLSALQPQPGLSSLPLSFLSSQTLLQLEVVDPSPGPTPAHQNISPMRAGMMQVSFTTLLLTPSPLPGTCGMFNEYSPNE